MNATVPKLILLLALPIVIVLLLYQPRHKALEKLIASRLPASNLQLGTTLTNWIATLGQPSTIPQLDADHTLLTWPQWGVAVVCHPLYQGQYGSLPPPMWTITSIILPVRQQIPALIVPAEPGTMLNFQTNLLSSEEAASFIGRKVGTAFQGTNLSALTIEKPDSWWGDYD